MRLLRAVFVSLVLIGISAVPALAQSSGFGLTVVVDGDDLIIGEPNNSFRPGTVYVYRKSAGGWEEAAQLRADDSQRDDGFGAVLALAGDTLFVAQRGGLLHTFERDGSSWRSTGTLNVDGLTGPDPGCQQGYGYCRTDFGIAIAAEGDWMMVGKPGRVATPERRGAPAQPAEPGAVYVFRRGGRPTGSSRATASEARSPLPTAASSSGHRPVPLMLRRDPSVEVAAVEGARLRSRRTRRRWLGSAGFWSSAMRTVAGVRPPHLAPRTSATPISAQPSLSRATPW